MERDLLQTAPAIPATSRLRLRASSRAVEDMDAVVRHLRERPDVDQSRLDDRRVSRGGILSIAYAGMRPATFQGCYQLQRWLAWQSLRHS